MGGGGGGGSNTVNENPLPTYATPYVQSFLTRSNALSLSGYQPYTGDTYAARNADEEDGITALATRAQNHHAIITRAETLLRNSLDGLKIGINPKLDTLFARKKEELIQEFEEETIPNLSRNALAVEGWGGGSHHIMQARMAESLAKKIADLVTELYGEDYFQEKEKRIASLGYGIRYGTEDMNDAEILRQAGLFNREYTQGIYDDTYKAWKDEETASVKRLEILGNAIRSLVGATNSEVKPLHRPNTMAEIAGLAMTGMSLYASFYGKGPTQSPTLSAGQRSQQQLAEGKFTMDAGLTTIQSEND